MDTVQSQSQEYGTLDYGHSCGSHEVGEVTVLVPEQVNNGCVLGERMVCTKSSCLDRDGCWLPQQLEMSVLCGIGYWGHSGSYHGVETNSFLFSSLFLSPGI